MIARRDRGARSALLVVANRIVAALTGLGLLLVVIRGLDGAAAAIYFFVQSLLLVFGALGRFGVPRTAVREVAAATARSGAAAGREVAERASIVNWWTTTAAAAALVVVMAARSSESTVTLGVVVLGGVWLLAEVRRAFWVEVIRGWSRIGEASLLGEGVRNSLVLVGAASLWTVDALTLERLLVLHVLAAGGLALYARRRARQSALGAVTDSPAHDLPTRSDLASRGFDVALAEGFGVWLMQGPVVLAGLFLTDAAVADLAVAVRFASLLTLPLIVTNQFFMPFVARANAVDRLHEIEPRVRGAAAIALGVGLAGAVGLVALGSSFTSLFEATGNVTALLAILSVGQLVSLACGPCAGFLQMAGLQRAVAAVHGLAAAGFTVAGVAFADAGSARGVALAATMGLIVANLLLVRAVWTRLGVTTVASARSVPTLLRPDPDRVQHHA